jgi:hypothetical protein
MKQMKKELSPKQRKQLLAALKARFDANKARHPGLVWAKVQARLETRPDKLWSLAEMERTGGEPDVVGVKSGEFVFMDCAPERPAGQRRETVELLDSEESGSRASFSWRDVPPKEQWQKKKHEVVRLAWTGMAHACRVGRRRARPAGRSRVVWGGARRLGGLGTRDCDESRGGPAGPGKKLRRPAVAAVWNVFSG